MANEFIKAEKVVSTALGLLEREVVLPNLVWRDAGGDFRGAKGDTITVRLPSYFKAKKRPLRSGAPRVKSQLTERAVPVTLTTDIYGDIPITDEELTLDIADFGTQVLNPTLSGVGRALEEELVETITGATYAHTLTLDTVDPFDTFVDARERLNNARVPFSGRAVAVGSAVESAILKSDHFNKVDQSGSDNALREAIVGRIAGFDVVSVPALAPDEAFAFHQTAYVQSAMAPVIPAGAPWGATQSFNGFAVRTVRVFDPDEVEDRFILDAWTGTDIVTDVGHLDPVTGIFEPAENPEESGAEEHFIRAVKIEMGSV
ncbi:P22 phage major capsid protein family protein [Nocardiopsis sp. TNDT3]|uniref:P22 phage major capsid protein family protein n=1 Tax=Nocardiopsis sp. TNDT3 TaxID=2249354 RepID=UPI000E3DC9EE|nr:P22 phage major capsid protein family protein [Nocardiopsis sp. TNDT3]